MARIRWKIDPARKIVRGKNPLNFFVSLNFMTFIFQAESKQQIRQYVLLYLFLKSSKPILVASKRLSYVHYRGIFSVNAHQLSATAAISPAQHINDCRQNTAHLKTLRGYRKHWPITGPPQLIGVLFSHDINHNFPTHP